MFRRKSKAEEDGKTKDDSKQQEVVKPDKLPAVEDRTLFLGCLTCIVASSYDYELTVEGNSNTSTNNKYVDTPNNKAKPSSLDDDDDDDHHHHDDDDVFQRASTSMKWDLDDTFDEALRDSTSTTTSPNRQPPKRSGSQKQGSPITEASQARLEAQIQAKLKLAGERHLVRRYQVAKEFIRHAAAHLLLEDMSLLVEQEFLPLLEVLLEPNQASLSNMKHSGSSNQLMLVDKAKEKAAETGGSSSNITKSASLQSLEWVSGNDALQQYLDQLKPEAAYQCFSWLFFQHLLHSEDSGGYDARIRFWFKTMAVTVFCMNSGDKNSQMDITLATRKFESLEACCADRLLTLAATKANNNSTDDDDSTANRRGSSMGQQIWKGLQIGGVGVGAGVLLAVTGGLAAPGIAAGLAALGMGAVAGTFLSLASSAAVVSLFGVAGGSLAAYKMNRRVSGLTEFTIHQQLAPPSMPSSNKKKRNDEEPPQPKAELSRTIGISGWLSDTSDYERPWGITPTNVPIEDRLERLQRFYYVHNPPMVEFAKDILKKHKNDPDKLWQQLNKKYGCNPDSPFDKANAKEMHENKLSDSEVKQLDEIIVAIGKVQGGESAKAETPVKKDDTNGEKSTPVKNKQLDSSRHSLRSSMSPVSSPKRESIFDKIKWGGGNNKTNEKVDEETEEEALSHPSKDEVDIKSLDEFEKVEIKKGEDFEIPDHLLTVWNYPKLYGGELYTVQWESQVLIDISVSVERLALELASTAGQQALKSTIAATLVLAAALPLTVMSFMNSIDADWTLVMDRADEAGRELARSLLINKGGSRPVTLVGYSFGARVIYSCLKALAQYQLKWDEAQMQHRKKHPENEDDDKHTKKSKKKKKPVVCKLPDIEFSREPASIVEDAIIMGLPKYLNLDAWKACREVVSGRLANVYSRSDKILSFMFKYKNMLGSFKPVVGTCTVAVPGVENIDVTDMVGSHEHYRPLVGKILERVRHGQPVRVSSHALDEVALMKEAEEEAKEAQEQQDGKEEPLLPAKNDGPIEKHDSLHAKVEKDENFSATLPTD